MLTSTALLIALLQATNTIEWHEGITLEQLVETWTEEAVHELTPSRQAMWHEPILDHSKRLQFLREEVDRRQERLGSPPDPELLKEAADLARGTVQDVVRWEEEAAKFDAAKWLTASSALLEELVLPNWIEDEFGRAWPRSDSSLIKFGYKCEIRIYRDRRLVRTALVKRLNRFGSARPNPTVFYPPEFGEVYLEDNGTLYFGRANIVVAVTLEKEGNRALAAKLDQLILANLEDQPVRDSVSEPKIRFVTAHPPSPRELRLQRLRERKRRR
ncbi:MAG: hypothetical protein AAF533_23270 [Acidobacteriota bacterium]